MRQACALSFASFSRCDRVTGVVFARTHTQKSGHPAGVGPSAGEHRPRLQPGQHLREEMIREEMRPGHGQAEQCRD